MDGTSDDDEWERIAEIGYLLMATQQHPTVPAPTSGPVNGPGTNRDGGRLAAEPQAQLPQYSGAGSPGRHHVTLSPAAPASGNRPNNIGPSPGGRVQEHHRHSTGVMRSHTPSGDPTGRRSSVSNRLRASIGGSALPRPNTSLRESRVRCKQTQLR